MKKTTEKSAEKEFSLDIDEANLSQELTTHSSKFAWVAEQAINAALQYDDFKFKVDKLYALIDKTIRDAAEADKRKMSEKKIEGEILTSEQYGEAINHLNRLRAHREVRKAKREAFRERGSMLVQLASTKRAEMDTIGFDAVKAVAM
jgi:hypothetical protein